MRPSGISFVTNGSLVNNSPRLASSPLSGCCPQRAERRVQFKAEIKRLLEEREAQLVPPRIPVGAARLSG
jgi:hypothetical protein